MTEVLQQKKFENIDIVITDPCYILKDKQNGVSYDLRMYGIHNFLSSTTFYGDWTCTVWSASDYKDCKEENKIGRFCADAGLVCVANLKEVLEYNPEFEQWIKDHDWCVTVIKNFTGIVKFLLTEKFGLVLKGFDTEGKVVWIAAQTGI